MTEMRSLQILNEHGDTTLVWTPDKDDEMRKLIKQKMREGMQFFLLVPTSDPLTPSRILVDAHILDEAVRQRVVVMKDRDFAQTVLDGIANLGRMMGAVQEKLTYRAAKSADEVIQHGRAAAVQQFWGG